MRAPTRTYWGWNADGARKVTPPTLIMVGEQDGLLKANVELHEDLGAKEKVYLAIACGTHLMNWEKQPRVLHKASADWLKNGSLGGARTGAFREDETGAISAQSR